jgi:hypothetical protein
LFVLNASGGEQGKVQNRTFSPMQHGWDMAHPGGFLVASRYRLWRHLLYWVIHILLFSFLFKGGFEGSTGALLLSSTVWVPAIILYTYPVMYYFIPRYLLRGRYTAFILIVTAWLIGGWVYNYFFRQYFLFPFFEIMGVQTKQRNAWAPASYLTLNTMLGVGCTIILFKYWMIKQRQWMEAEQAKSTAELQLLKAQVHPHFLFNTLNNIYAFSLEQSPKTPDLILKLSSLLSYMLYECKETQVSLEKELRIMGDYISLEKERYGDRIDISLEMDEDLGEYKIAPLLILPLLENAFKHGTSNQVEKPWLNVTVRVQNGQLRAKIVNGCNGDVIYSENGIGIRNLKQRLALLYPNSHQIRFNREENFYAVSLVINLNEFNQDTEAVKQSPVNLKKSDDHQMSFGGR